VSNQNHYTGLACKSKRRTNYNDWKIPVPNCLQEIAQNTKSPTTVRVSNANAHRQQQQATTKSDNEQRQRATPESNNEEQQRKATTRGKRRATTQGSSKTKQDTNETQVTASKVIHTVWVNKRKRTTKNDHDEQQRRSPQIKSCMTTQAPRTEPPNYPTAVRRVRALLRNTHVTSR
jgi:hypothetical protein